MNYVFGWRFDTSEYIKKFTEKETLSYIHEHPNKLKPCHDEPVLIVFMETVAAGEMILGDITCSCGIRFGLLEFIPDTDFFRIITAEDVS
ncbi:MAG: hypothetical protein IIC11_10445 [Proteobacteria bacterium]|nr:hypothetical protein [Pseudomonadota bacterium]